MTLYKHHCVNVLFPENNFYSQVNCSSHLMIQLQKIDTLMIVRGNKIYLWNELHSIVVVKYKHSSISGIWGNKEIYIILFRKRSANII